MKTYTVVVAVVQVIRILLHSKSNTTDLVIIPLILKNLVWFLNQIISLFLGQDVSIQLDWAVNVMAWIWKLDTCML